MTRRNPAPPPPFNSTWQQLLAWAQRTYAPGTVVRIDSWDEWSVGQMADPSSRDTRVTVPAGTRGTVVGVARSGYGVVIWIRVHDARSYIHALPDKLDREMTNEMWERLDASGQDVVSKYLGQDSLSQIVPLDDHWAQASKPMSRHALPSSQKRTSRRLRPNAVPPPSMNVDDGTPYRQWVRKTFREGTPVRTVRPVLVRNDDYTRLPVGTKGVVDFFMDGGTSLRVSGVIHEPLLVSATPIPFAFDLSWDEVTRFIEPLVDNWGPLTTPAKRHSPPPQSGWARQLRASRRVRPNLAPPKSQRTSRRMTPNPYLHATRGDLAKQILEERKLRAFPSRKYEGRPAVFAGDARSPTMADAAMRWADVKHSFHFGAHPEEENVLIEFDARPPDDRRGPTGMPSADGDEAVWFDDVDLVNPRVVRRRKGEMVWNGRRTSRRRTSRRTR